jgi:hypothetical protein
MTKDNGGLNPQSITAIPVVNPSQQQTEDNGGFKRLKTFPVVIQADEL